MGFNAENYGWNNYYSYVELTEGADYRKVNEKIKDFLLIKTQAAYPDYDPITEASIELFLFPLKDIYLHSVTGKGGNITYVYLFSIIAVFILSIACINFMNLSTARAGRLPFEIGSNSGGISWEGRETKDDVLIGFGFTDFGYLETLGMEMKTGRFFEEGYGTDTISSIILNEKAAKVMGMEDPLGKWVSWGEARFSVIGIIRDFHFLPMTEEIGPLVLINARQECNILFVKVGKDNPDQTISFLQDIWERINPGFPFDYKFLDKAYNELYVSEDRLGETFKYFSFLAIIISCLGLFGLAAFMAEQRTREIVIRKVLGATASFLISLIMRHLKRDLQR